MPTPEAAEHITEQRLIDFYANVIHNPWIKAPVHPKQRQFLLMSHIREVFFGGQGGGGKSMALWFGALQYVDVPGYAALILRKTYADLAKPGALMDRSKSYLAGTQAEWNEQKKQWTFPSGATITFGYLDSEDDKFNFQSAEFQYIAFDELSHFTESQYTYLFTRLRKPKEGRLADVPLRMRSASNPGGRGHIWVKRRFIDPSTRNPKTVFIPATMDDNPTLDKEEYLKSLAEADHLTREQIEKGNWEAVETGQFKREWFRYYRRDPFAPEYIVTDEGERFHPMERPRWQTCDPAAGLTTKADNFVVSTWCLSPKANLIWLGCFLGHFDIIDQMEHCAILYSRWNPQFITVEEVLNQRQLAQALRRSLNPVMVVKSVNPRRRKKGERAIPAFTFAASGRLYLPYDDRSFPKDVVEAEALSFTGEDGNRDDTFDSLMYSIEVLSEVSMYSGLKGSSLVPSAVPLFQGRRALR